MKLRFLLAATALLSALAPAARGTVLVYDGFHPADYNNVPADGNNQVNTTFTAGHTVGISSSTWGGPGGAMIKVYGENYGLSFSQRMVAHGFTAIGGSVGMTPSENNAGMRAKCHNLASNVLKASAGTNLYFRVLLNVDSTAAGKLTAVSDPASASAKYFGAGFAQSDSNYYLLTQKQSALAFVVWKNGSNQYVLSLAHTTASGTTATFYPLVTGITLGETYVCYAEVQVGAGENGQEIVRAGAVAGDFTGAAPWAAIGDSSDSIEVELITDSSYPTAMAVAGPYGTNGGYFRADEFVVGTELGDILPVGSLFAVLPTGTPTVGIDSFSTDWILFEDEGVPADAGIVWSTDTTFATATTNSLGTGLAPDTRTASLTGLEPATTYWWFIYADNGTEVAESTPASFTTPGAPILGTATATLTGDSAAFSVALAEAALLNTLPTSVSVFYGTDGTTWTELPLGSASTATTLSGTADNLGYAVAYQWFVRATATMPGGRVISTDSTTESFITLWNGDLYVDAAAANATLPYATPETAANTIAAALTAATDGATIHVAPGLYPITTPVAVNKAIRVLGDDPDPSRVAVSNTTNAGSGNGNHRVFTLNHADALVANLTMQNGLSWGTSGSSFYIDSNGGTVSNCVVEAGSTKGNSAHSGGAVLNAGCVTHTIFRKCKVGSNTSSDSSHKNLAAVLSLSGHSLAENCLFADNTQDRSKALVLIRLNDYSTIRNCTIVDSGLGSTNGACTVFSALYINSANATAQNVVVAGVTNLIDGAACRPSGTVSKFLNGAVDADISGVSAFPATTIVGTESQFFPHHAENVPYAVKYRPGSGGLLVNKGADYEPMALYDLSGEQKRKVGAHVDIGCYEANAAGTIIVVK